MERVKSDHTKILIGIFLGNLLVCKSETDTIKYLEVFKAEKNLKKQSGTSFQRGILKQ